MEARSPQRLGPSRWEQGGWRRTGPSGCRAVTCVMYLTPPRNSNTNQQLTSTGREAVPAHLSSSCSVQRPPDDRHGVMSPLSPPSLLRSAHVPAGSGGSSADRLRGDSQSPRFPELCRGRRSGVWRLTRRPGPPRPAGAGCTAWRGGGRGGGRLAVSGRLIRLAGSKAVCFASLSAARSARVIMTSDRCSRNRGAAPLPGDPVILGRGGGGGRGRVLDAHEQMKVRGIAL